MIELPDWLAERVTALADEQGRAVGDVAVDMIATALPVDAAAQQRVKARLSFTAMADDGPPDLAANYKRYRRERSKHTASADA